MTGYKTKSSKVSFKNNWITIRSDEIVYPDGREGIYNIVETNGPSVFIVAVTDKSEIYFIELFRYPTQTKSIELPGGSSDNQDIVHAAKRELQEETGLRAAKWTIVGKSQVMNGVTNELQYTLLAEELTETPVHKKEEEGITAVRKIPLREVLSMIKIGEISDGQTITAILQTLLFLGYDVKK